MYFENKIKYSHTLDNIFFASNFNCKHNNHYVFNFLNSNKLSLILIFEFIYHLFFAIFIKLIGVKTIVFDNAHISNMFFAILCRIMNIRLIFTIHDALPHPGKKFFMTNLYNKFAYFVASKIIVFSNLYDHPKHIYTRLAGFKWLDIKKENSNKKMNVLFFGRLESYKGLNFIPDIYKATKKIIPECKFTVAGSGDIPDSISILESEHFKIINKYLLDDEVRELFQESFCSILPYESATQSGVSILSYSMNCPVVAFDVGAIGQYINDNSSKLIEPYDIDAFVSAIICLYRNQEAINLQTVFENEFSYNAGKKVFFKLLKEIS